GRLELSDAGDHRREAEDMSADGLLTEFTATITFDRYEDIRAALFDPNLSRTFDKRSYEDGNIRAGIVSIAHGAVHRARRRVENTQFRADVLRLYERELFPRSEAHTSELQSPAD